MKRFVKGLLVFVIYAASSCATSTKTVYDPQADREGIKQVVQPRLKDLRECYEMAIDAYPGAEGKVMADWDIAKDGSVANLKFSEFDKTLEGGRACLMERISSWRFPKPSSDEAVSVKYPFIFSERASFKR